MRVDGRVSRECERAGGEHGPADCEDGPANARLLKPDCNEQQAE